MKKFAIFLFSLFIISFGVYHSAFASTNDAPNVEVTKILSKIDKTNVKIQDLIDEAILETSKISLKETEDLSKLDNEAERNICIQKANCAIIKVMENLIVVTDKIAGDMVKEAAEYGIIVIQEYIPITVNGVTYMVDPLQVTN